MPSVWTPVDIRLRQGVISLLAELSDGMNPKEQLLTFAALII